MLNSLGMVYSQILIKHSFYVLYKRLLLHNELLFVITV